MIRGRKDFEIKMKRGGGGGGGGGVGLNRWVRVVGRFSPFNVHKWVLKQGLKNLEKLMYCVGNERLQKTKREEDEQCAHKKFCNRARFHKLKNFSNLEFLHCSKLNLPSATPAKQRTKFIRICK